MIQTENLVSSQVLERFVKLLAAKRLAHAYLFVGPKCIGKEETALAAARLVNCENPTPNGFCDACPACVKIKNGTHPDVHMVAQGESSIKIEDIRDLSAQSQLRSFEAKVKGFIIRDIERLTLEAGNALLKTLEEPTPNTLIILTTSILDSVLPTIKSRCQVFYFFPTSSASLKKRFLTDYHFSEPESHFLAYFSEGCPGRIPDGDHQAILKRRNDTIDQFVLSQNEEAYLKIILPDHDKIVEMIHFLFCWFKDLLLLKMDVPKNRIINIDRMSDLEHFKNRYSFEECEGILNEITKTRKALEENFNVKIPLALLKERIWKK